MEDKILVRPAWMSLLLGLLALPAMWIPDIIFSTVTPIGLSIAGAASALQALRIIRSDRETYKGMGFAIAGLIISGLAALVSILATLLFAGSCAWLVAGGS